MNFLFSHGRTAFKYGLIYLGLKKNDKIMLPEYLCDILLDPLEDLGIKPVFYQVNEDFTADWKSIKNKYQKSVKALMVINYFGLSENKKKFNIFCKKKNLFLIEDDCHSLNINKKNVHNYSNIIFSSLRKILIKSYSGGVLSINSKLDDKFLNKFKLKRYQVSFKTRINNFLENNLLIFKRFLKFKLLKMPNFSKLNSIKNEKITEDFLIDDFSKKVFLKKKFNEIKKTRIKNYMIWRNLCKKNKSIEIIKRNLNKNTIPWVFPVFVKNNQTRKKLFQYGWRNGYSIISWPTLPANLVNKRNKKIWNKLVCFNTDRAPNIKNINFNNIKIR